MMETIGKRIAAFRFMREWTQERLASEVGITQSVLSDIETDKTSPTWALITRIAEALEIPAISLVPSQASTITNNQFTDNAIANNIVHQYNNMSGDERKTWEQLVKAKDEIIAAKDQVIAALREKSNK
jgi:transcriptional regulator with XRE-family HTH domain